MAQSVLVKHKESGLVKKGKFGFSWTYLFFGWFVSIIRGELGIAALHLLFSICTFGLWQIICSFIYNKQYMTRLLTNGWTFSDVHEVNKRAMMALGVAGDQQVENISRG